MTASYRNAIAANISTMNEILGKLAAQGAEAETEIENGNQNGAIGWMAEFDSLLNTAQSLYGAALALHRQP